MRVISVTRSSSAQQMLSLRPFTSFVIDIVSVHCVKRLGFLVRYTCTALAAHIYLDCSCVCDGFRRSGLLISMPVLHVSSSRH